MSTCRLSLVAALLLAAGAAGADTAWISDRLQAGLHEAPDPSSTVLTLLSTGTPVEVLERDGIEGWLDAMYLSDDKPDALVLAEVEAARADAVAELESARSRIEDLEAQLAAFDAAAADELAAGEQGDGGAAGGANGVRAASFEAPVNSETLREMQRLAEENQRVRQRLAEAEAAAAMALEQVERAPPEPPPRQSETTRGGYAHYLLAVRDWSHWEWLALGSALLLVFGLGAWISDMGVRRRHGGFRVRV